MLRYLRIFWCSFLHGGGTIKRDSEDRINWQCSKCGRWAIPIDKRYEKLVVDGDIERNMK